MLVVLATLLAVLPGCDVLRAAPAAEAGHVTIEAAFFQGGYGIAWHQEMAARFNALDNGIQVNLWGDPRVVEKVKPRILRGNPPDLIVTRYLPVWVMIGAEKLHPFDAALDSPPWEMTGMRADMTQTDRLPLPPGEGWGEGKWRAQFIPGTLDAYTSDGKVYAVPSAFGAWACWYDGALFRREGWTPPTTWAEFDALCGQIKASGRAPLAFQGKFPIYAWWTFISLIQRCGGLEALNRINALEAGAFQHPDVVRAAGLLQDMALRWFQPGAMAMTHTESQLQWVNGKAAMIFCGMWLPNEMKAAAPPELEMRCFNVPAVEGGRGNPALFNGEGSEFLFVPSNARHPEAALEFARFLVSKENASSMGAQIGVISPLEGAAKREDVGPALASALDMVAASEGIFTCRVADLLLEWRSETLEPAFADLLRGDIAPAAFCRRLDAGVAEAVAAGVYVPPYVPYDPAVYGEGP